MHVSKARLVNAAAERFEVVSAALELAGSADNEVFGGENCVGRREEVGSFVDVERKNGVDSVSGEVWRITECAGWSDPLGPERFVEASMPSGLVAVGDLVERLAEIPVLALCDSVRFGVVT